MNRRTALQALGGASALGALGSTHSSAITTTHPTELCLVAPDDADTTTGYGYQFAVSGEIKKADTARDAPIQDRYVSRNPHDDVDVAGCRVHGRVEGGADCYRFTGKLLAFSIDQNYPGKYDVYVNGRSHGADELVTRRDPSDVPCDDDGEGDRADDEGEQFCELKNKIRVSPHKSKSDPFTVEVQVSGKLEMSSGKRVDGTKLTVEGRGSAADEWFPYSGVITKLSTSGPGYVSITQDEACGEGA